MNSKSPFSKMKILILTSLMILIGEMAAYAGGPWVLGKGNASLTLGYSRKTAGTRWAPPASSINTQGTPEGWDDTWGADSLQSNQYMIDGKFHDFRYVYIQPVIGITDRLEISANILWLDGWEVSTKDPLTGATLYELDSEGNPVLDEEGNPIVEPEWEINKGLTDFWLGIKYQVLKGNWPVAIEVNSRFPDFYSKSSDVYARYDFKYFTNADGTKDTVAEASSEWRGLKKRDFNFLVHAGKSFGNAKNNGWVQAYAGYSIRQDAFADQFLAGITGGYNFGFHEGDIILTPSAAFYYDNGLNNGDIPDATDRFLFNGRPNYYFNDPTTGRLYGSATGTFFNQLSVSLGAGYWIFGHGCPQYKEVFAQVAYLIPHKCK